MVSIVCNHTGLWIRTYKKCHCIKDRRIPWFWKTRTTVYCYKHDPENTIRKTALTIKW